MLVLVTYDVRTDGEGKKRLRRIAKICEDYGQRVQNSVFECELPFDVWLKLREKILRTYNAQEDSIRFYFLGNNWQKKVEHFGVKESWDLGKDPLVL